MKRKEYSSPQTKVMLTKGREHLMLSASRADYVDAKGNPFGSEGWDDGGEPECPSGTTDGNSPWD